MHLDSLVFRAAQKLAQNLAMRYPLVFNADWVQVCTAAGYICKTCLRGLLNQRLTSDSKHLPSIAKSMSNLLKPLPPYLAGSEAAAVTVESYPSLSHTSAYCFS